jgi:hypothetical protein
MVVHLVSMFVPIGYGSGLAPWMSATEPGLIILALLELQRTYSGAKYRNATNSFAQFYGYKGKDGDAGMLLLAWLLAQGYELKSTNSQNSNGNTHGIVYTLVK